jgi:hypothetical protein
MCCGHSVFRNLQLGVPPSVFSNLAELRFRCFFQGRAMRRRKAWGEIERERELLRGFLDCLEGCLDRSFPWVKLMPVLARASSFAALFRAFFAYADGGNTLKLATPPARQRASGARIECTKSSRGRTVPTAAS